MKNNIEVFTGPTNSTKEAANKFLGDLKGTVKGVTSSTCVKTTQTGKSAHNEVVLTIVVHYES